MATDDSHRHGSGPHHRSVATAHEAQFGGNRKKIKIGVSATGLVIKCARSN
jgi:hypothetical protein